MADMKRAIKDSVFSYLFRQPEYKLELYKTLHPEDGGVKEEDVKLVTIENILSNGLHNDLGLLVRNILIILMEAQSTFSFNISLRLFLYLAESYKQHVEENKLDLYGSKTVRIPRPELYVVYTGDKRDVPDVIRLSDLYEGEGDVELTIRVIRSSGNGSIVDQYIRFCKIADEERKKWGYTPEAVEETIRRCLKENVLAPFLASRRKEVQNIMITLFNQEKVTEIHDYNLAMEAHAKGKAEGEAEGMAKGKAEGRAEGKAESRLEIAKNLLSIKIPYDQIAAATGLSLAEVAQLAG